MENKVAIYIRVSTQYQIDRDSLPMQRKDLVDYCHLILNTDSYEIFEDAGYSGKNTDRPKFQEMLKRLRTGEFTHLLVWKIDRISRNLLDFSTLYKELKDLGVTFVSMNEQFDTSSAMGEAMLKIILVFAELERNMTSERVTATMISRANNGQWNGGRIPYGYNYDPIEHEFSIKEDEAYYVRFMHDFYEKNSSLVTLCHEINDMGCRTRLGFAWSPTSIDLILKNVFYCGDYRYNVLKEGNRQKVKDESEWVTFQDHHAPIVSREQKERVIAILKEQQRLHKEKHIYKSKHVHVFSGIMLCEKCGATMYSMPAPSRDKWPHSFYMCSNRRKSLSICTQQSVSDTIVGEFAFNLILNMLNAQSAFTKKTTPEELQANILVGETFKNIIAIDPDDIADLHTLLLSGNATGNIYGKNFKQKPPVKHKSELSKLSSQRDKVLRALDRLKSLYLYSDDVMSEKDYIIQHEKLEDELDEINQQLDLAKFDPEDPADDDAFIQKSSEFIIAKNLTSRKYIYYKRLAQSVDQETLRSFVSQVFDQISVYDDHFISVTFVNGIKLHFEYKKEP